MEVFAFQRPLIGLLVRFQKTWDAPSETRYRWEASWEEGIFMGERLRKSRNFTRMHGMEVGKIPCIYSYFHAEFSKDVKRWEAQMNG